MIKLGLVGEKLGHSLSPKIHGYILKNIGVEGEYALYEFSKSQSSHILESMIENRVTGFNVTVPYKEVFFDKLDWISKEAQEIGAVNTVVIKDFKSYGYNTDYYGVFKIFEKCKINVEGKTCYILGSGGAAKSVIVALKDLKAKKIVVVSREPNKILDIFNGKFPYVEVVNYDKIEGGDIIINTTPVGMFPNVDKTPVEKEVIKKFKVAIDLIYNPNKTKFLQIASECGLTIENGLSMLIKQAIKAQEIWQDMEFDGDLYCKLENYLLEEKI